MIKKKILHILLVLILAIGVVAPAAMAAPVQPLGAGGTIAFTVPAVTEVAENTTIARVAIPFTNSGAHNTAIEIHYSAPLTNASLYSITGFGQPTLQNWAPNRILLYWAHGTSPNYYDGIITIDFEVPATSAFNAEVTIVMGPAEMNDYHGVPVTVEGTTGVVSRADTPHPPPPENTIEFFVPAITEIAADATTVRIAIPFTNDGAHNTAIQINYSDPLTNASLYNIAGFGQPTLQNWSPNVILLYWAHGTSPNFEDGIITLEFDVPAGNPLTPTPTITIISGPQNMNDYWGYPVTVIGSTGIVARIVTHNVTFDLQGGGPAVAAQTVANNGLATRPPVNPTRTGYNFVNWFTAPTGGTVFNFAALITADTVAYARWTAQPTPPPGEPGPGGPGPGGPGQTPQDPTLPTDDENDNDNDNENDNENDNDNQNDNDVLIPIDPTPVILTHYAYMIGFEDGTVRPQANITRAEATTIFFRLISDTHRDGIWSRSNGFNDVALTSWYNTAISTMDNGGFVAGYPDGYFRPNQSITRAEMTALVVRFMGYGHLTNVSGSTFSDAEGHWAQDAITVASRRGWVTGFEDGTFRPNQPITRAETAALVNRMLGRLPENSDDLLEDMLTWPDNMNVNAWYYLYIQEATNSHYHVMKADGIHETWTQLIAPRDWRSLELLD